MPDVMGKLLDQLAVFSKETRLARADARSRPQTRHAIAAPQGVFPRYGGD